jgi:hypothetical protein
MLVRLLDAPALVDVFELVEPQPASPTASPTAQRRSVLLIVMPEWYETAGYSAETGDVTVT